MAKGAQTKTGGARKTRGKEGDVFFRFSLKVAVLLLMGPHKKQCKQRSRQRKIDVSQR